METVKILINSTISTKGVRIPCWDIENIYTNSRLEEPEYMKIHIQDIPKEVNEEYNVMEYANKDGYMYCEITIAMYSLVQAGRITNLDLMNHLEPHSYYPSKSTPGLWFH